MLRIEVDDLSRAVVFGIRLYCELKYFVVPKAQGECDVPSKRSVKDWPNRCCYSYEPDNQGCLNVANSVNHCVSGSVCEELSAAAQLAEVTVFLEAKEPADDSGGKEVDSRRLLSATPTSGGSPLICS
jgi:hypothetical protein